MQTDPGAAIVTTPQARRDDRAFWRITLAVVAPLAMLAKAGYYLLFPADGGAEFPEAVSDITANTGTAAALQWLDLIFVVGLVPAIIAVAWVSKRRAPRLTTVGALLAIAGFLAGFGKLPNSDLAALITAQDNLDIATMTSYVDALNEQPLTGVATLMFFLGLLIGLPLLGVAMWRSQAAPAWMGLALIIGTITHPFLPNPVMVAIGLAIAAVGFAGASLALLRMTNDEFDLPPLPRD